MSDNRGRGLISTGNRKARHTIWEMAELWGVLRSLFSIKSRDFNISLLCLCFMFIFNYALQPFKAYCAICVNVPTFATRRLHACHHARAPSGGGWNCGREMSGRFCQNAYFHVTFRYLLHAVKLRHETDGFTSSPKEGVLRIFSP
jgi:hypothetical protein